MNTKQQNVLRSLLKKYKYKNVSNMVRMALGINYENFLQKTEPLYVIPRIASCYSEEDKKKELNGIVYKEWLKDVVEKHWVAPINEYSNEHGERLVLSAIYYLVDNDLWDVYEGRLALDAREDNYYDKLDDMPSAIAIAKESAEAKAQIDTPEIKLEVKGNINQAKSSISASGGSSASNSSSASSSSSASNRSSASGESSTPLSDKDNWPFAPDYVLNINEAETLIGSSVEICAHLKDNIDRLADYIFTAADSDVLRDKINKQEQQLEALKVQHQKEISELQVKLDEMKAKADESNATMNKASDFIAKQKRQLSEAQKQYDELNAKYKKALDERDDADKELVACKKLLDEEASKEQLPKKKVIPRSALDSVPLLGRGVMTGLVPVLAKYNITVDPNR